jgi:hypothetical protein
MVTQHYNQLGLPLFLPRTSIHPSNPFSPSWIFVARIATTISPTPTLLPRHSPAAAMSSKASPHARQKPEQKPATTPSSSNIKQTEGTCTCDHPTVNTKAATSTPSPSLSLPIPSAKHPSSSFSGPTPLSPYTNLSRDLKTNDMVFGPIPDREYHEGFMRKAIEMAQLALHSDETPVGCVFVRDGEVIGRGINGTNASLNVSLGNIFHFPFQFDHEECSD